LRDLGRINDIIHGKCSAQPLASFRYLKIINSTVLRGNQSIEKYTRHLDLAVLSSLIEE